LAQALDHIRSFVPPSFEVNLILRHESDPQAHMLLGQSSAADVKKAVDEILADPGHFSMEGSADDGVRAAGADVSEDISTETEKMIGEFLARKLDEIKAALGEEWFMGVLIIPRDRNFCGLFLANAEPAIFIEELVAIEKGGGASGRASAEYGVRLAPDPVKEVQ
jgi:hypothetical protein